ncbi:MULTISPECIES: (2Fe-2S)-binding protein [unclassified Streptomyces]|uniref:(2Fe-2S)-binding protein n=1 Tax=unclassified Streptomyces TaxID=2593676 RepID=UPI001F04B8A2|nr:MULTISPECIES: (2Fe-2S)-binding protein [unclassified Streptomyces]MCH0564565.1 (2Fe-2S)-binding protein [Streptomyces sp. MUM 2J]MCH0572272.1 (2Fe-2S)-binding protein [Streptomyces sp. MUM 136J]
MVLLPVVDLDPDLAALRPLGGFFLLRTTGAPPARLPTLARVYEGETSDVYGDPLTFRVGKVAAGIRAAEVRVAASVAHLGLAARLWSVALGCAVLYDCLPDLDPRMLHWDPDGSAPGELHAAAVCPRPVEGLAAQIVDGHLVPLEAALRTRYRLAPGLLRGNAASALAGAAGQLDRWARAAGRADRAERARALAAGLLRHPRLAGAGTLTGTAFRRRSCCLYYRVPGGGVCGDCCFARPPRSSPGASSG